MLDGIPSELIGLVIFAVAALLKWLGDRATEKEAKATPPAISRRTAEPREAASSTRSDPEAERKRRFMEALGIPAQDVAGPIHDVPQTLRPEYRAEVPAQSRESRTKPIPPIVYADPENWRKLRPKPGATPPPLVSPPAIPPLPAALIVPAVSPILVADPVAHLPGDLIELQGLSIGDVAEENPDLARDLHLAALREQLRTPEALRRAFLVREILGPPLGLQSPRSAPSFRSP